MKKILKGMSLFILALFMVFTSANIPVFAANEGTTKDNPKVVTTADQLNEALHDSTKFIKIDADFAITGNGSWDDNTATNYAKNYSTKTIDLNGHQLTGNGITVGNYAKLYIEDSSSPSTGSITGNDYKAFTVNGGATLYIKGGSVTSQWTTTNDNEDTIFLAWNSASVQVDGGKVTATGSTAEPFCFGDGSNLTVTINDGEVISSGSVIAWANSKTSGFTGALSDYNKITVNGGKISAANSNVFDITKANTVLNGGEYNNKPSYTKLGDGKQIVSISDGNYKYEVADDADSTAANKWKSDNATVIDDNYTVTKDSVAALTTAINGYDALTAAQKAYIDSTLISSTTKDGKTTHSGKLQDKLDAANFLSKYDTLLSKPVTELTANQLQGLASAYDELKALSNYDNVKNYLSDDVKNLLENAAALKAFKSNEDYNAVLNKKTVTGNDAEAIKKALDAANALKDKLTGNNKNMLDSAITDLTNKKAVADWMKKYSDTALSDKAVSANDPAFGTALKEYKALTDEQKKLIDPDIAKKFAAKTEAYNWLQAYNKAVKDNDAEALKKVVDSLNNLGDDAKKYISDDTLKALSEDIKKASPNANSFIDTYFKGVTEVTKDNYKKILESKDAWNKLDDTTKSLIEYVLKAQTGKSYEDLMSDAEKISKQVASKTANTSDTSNVLLYGCLGLSTMLAAIGLVILRRREEME